MQHPTKRATGEFRRTSLFRPTASAPASRSAASPQFPVEDTRAKAVQTSLPHFDVAQAVCPEPVPDRAEVPRPRERVNRVQENLGRAAAGLKQH